MNLVSSQIRSAFFFTTSGEADRPFSGDSRSVEFVSVLPIGYENRAGLYYVNYFVEEDRRTGLKTLKVFQRPVFRDEPPLDVRARESRPLITDLVDARWAYFNGDEWLDEWDREEGSADAGPPGGVRLTLSYLDGERPETVERNIYITAGPGDVKTAETDDAIEGGPPDGSSNTPFGRPATTGKGAEQLFLR